MAKVAVILSGCGVFDGAEIHESVLTMLALEENEATYQCFAPDITQREVINHLTGEPVEETRNVLVEAARIARGNIKPLSDLVVEEFNALIFPGGFGAAKNLSDFAAKGAACSVDPSVKAVAGEFARARKPIGYICISPAMIPLIHGEKVKLTIGNDEETAAAIESMGGLHLNCPVDDFVVDADHLVVSTPAYMLAGNLTEAASGIRKLVHEVLMLTG